MPKVDFRELQQPSRIEANTRIDPAQKIEKDTNEQLSPSENPDTEHRAAATHLRETLVEGQIRGCHGSTGLAIVAQAILERHFSETLWAKGKNRQEKRREKKSKKAVDSIIGICLVLGKGAKITQPSFYIAGKADGLSGLYPPIEKLGVGLPGLVGTLAIDNVGHWVQHEAAAEVNDQIVKFLRTVNPA